MSRHMCKSDKKSPKKAKYECGKCGSKAENKDDLCKPKKR